MLGTAVTGQATTFNVTTAADSGSGSLRDAVAQANAAGGANTIQINVGGTIALTSGEIAIHGPLSMVGPGADSLTIDGGGKGRIFSIYATDPACPAPDGPDYTVSIAGMRLTNAQPASAGAGGGAIFTEHSLTLAAVVVDNSTASNGGAVFMALQYPTQTLGISGSQFNNNLATPIGANAAGMASGGGAIQVSERCTGTRTTPASLNVASSVFSGNRVQAAGSIDGYGGAIYTRFSGDVGLSDTRIVDNHVDPPGAAGALYAGGGVFVAAAMLKIERSEIAQNSADSGGGIYLQNNDPALQAPGSTAQAQLINSTVGNNSVLSGQGGGMLVYGNVAAEADNSTFAYNAAQGSGMTGGIHLDSGPTAPVSAANASAPSLKLVSSIIGSSNGVDLGSTVANIPALTVNSTRSLVELFCSTCNLSFSGSGNLLGVDPMFDPLAFNGGPTRTYALFGGSLAINAGSNPLGLSTDQRGMSYGRTGSGVTDMGALETDSVLPVTLIEYYHAALDHYFITWVPDEIAKLDNGTLQGWTRTGLSIKAYPVQMPDTSPVCRIYIPPGLGDGHFFGRDPGECASTMAKNPSFDLESSDFFDLYLPNAGTCAVGTLPVYRVFSNRADINHRYTTSRSVRDQMVAQGWLAEGDGPNIVAMCAPQ